MARVFSTSFVTNNTTIEGQEEAMIKHRCACATICQSVQRRAELFWHKIYVCACAQKSDVQHAQPIRLLYAN